MSPVDHYTNCNSICVTIKMMWNLQLQRQNIFSVFQKYFQCISKYLLSEFIFCPQMYRTILCYRPHTVLNPIILQMKEESTQWDCYRGALGVLLDSYGKTEPYTWMKTSVSWHLPNESRLHGVQLGTNTLSNQVRLPWQAALPQDWEKQNKN